MLTMYEFYTYIKNHAEIYYPEFKNAKFSLYAERENGKAQKILMVKIRGLISSPKIKFETIYQDFLDGKSMKKCIGRIFDLNLTCIDNVSNNVVDYQSIQKYLSVRICSLEDNSYFLKGKPYTVIGDYAAYYGLDLPMLSEEELKDSTVTNDMLEKWEISKEKLHEDAMKSVSDENICLRLNLLPSVDDLNQYNIPISEENKLDKMESYCLTNRNHRYGAASILNTDALKKIGKMLGENFFIMPSSIHEVKIIPDSPYNSVKELNEWLQSINSYSDDDQLSSYVQYFDRDKGIFYNPEKQPINVVDYQSIQKYLSVRICSLEDNSYFLEGKPYTVIGDYAVYYGLELPMLSKEELKDSAVTNDILEKWGISKEMLHEDAMKSVSDENICLRRSSLPPMDDLNQYNIPISEENKLHKWNSYSLTNRNYRYGAASILNIDVLKKIGKMLGENFYILPFSVHNVEIWPETLAGSVKELNELMQSINSYSHDNQLSSNVQYFDRDKGIFYNPEKQPQKDIQPRIQKNLKVNFIKI